jgi:hypothetical protein
VLPFVLAIVLRKPIRKVVPIILGSALLIACVGFFLLLSYIGISLLWDLMS